MSENISYVPFIIIAIVAVVVLIIISGMTFFGGGYDDGVNNDESSTNFKTFDSEKEFNEYLDSSNSLLNSFTGAVIGQPRTTISPTPVPRGSFNNVQGDTAMNAESSGGVGGGSSGGYGGGSKYNDFSTRQTNTQEKGVGEPDIVKVTSEKTYYVAERFGYNRHPPIPEPTDDITRDIKLPREQNDKMYVINNPNKGEYRKLNVTNNIDQDGKILRDDDNIIVYNQTKILGYSINNSIESEDWRLDLNESNTVVTTRRVGSNAYFVVKQRTNNGCSIRPIESYTTIECTDIYYPTSGADSDTVYTVFSVNMNDGDIKGEISFVGSSKSTSIYMSSDSIYVSYKQTDFEFNDIIDLTLNSNIIDKNSESYKNLENLKELDISDEAKSTEFRNIIDQMNNSNELQMKIRKKINSHVSENARDIFRSDIVRIDAKDGGLEQSAVGSVPGEPLNQFSIDEYNDKIRIATTVRPDDRQNSENDVYILDNNLEIEGSVKGMAKGQRIYGTRFIGDKAYVITYRQVDPLHIIDLSNSSEPKEVGTLKLPGFSEYLHKIDEGKILGVGRSQDNNAKVVLFDVSNQTNPIVADSIVYEDIFSSSVSETHHAFNYDDTRENIYLPSEKGMHIIEYQNDSLVKKDTIKVPQSERTRIYNDTVAIFGKNDIIGLDRDTYKKTSQIDLK